VTPVSVARAFSCGVPPRVSVVTFRFWPEFERDGGSSG
jgi:hypothetical protein